MLFRTIEYVLLTVVIIYMPGTIVSKRLITNDQKFLATFCMAVKMDTIKISHTHELHATSVFGSKKDTDVCDTYYV